MIYWSKNDGTNGGIGMSWWFWIGAFAFTAVCIASRIWEHWDKAKEKKMEGFYCSNCKTMTMEVCSLCPHCGHIMEVIQTNEAKEKLWQCECCQLIDFTPQASCRACNGVMRLLTFESMALLETYVMHAELRQCGQQIAQVVPGQQFSSEALMKINHFLIMHDRLPTTQELASMDELSTGYAPILSTQQAICSLRRLEFARYLVATGKLNEWQVK